MKNKSLKALALGLSVTTLMMMGSIPAAAEENAAETEAVTEETAEGEDADQALQSLQEQMDVQLQK